MNQIDCDVAIIGGGPAGSTTACLIKKYNPDLKVVVFERETFPRDHIGESLLPPICGIIDEMGCWDEIDSAGFPIKIGATYRWGRTPELWDFNFYPPEKWVDEPRPAPLKGARAFTALQVDRSIYDEILLNHAKKLGVEVHQPAKVAKVGTEGDTVTGLTLQDGAEVKAKYYVDASGNSGLLRRALNVECDYPSTLKNISIYDYWQNTDWSTHIGVGGTRILVLTLGYGWLWFIPVGPTRTSVGIVMPVDYYKETGLTPQQAYDNAMAEEPRLAKLLANATCENKLTTTRDWSFMADRQCGENWFLVGEAGGFADPILSAGVTMAHIGGRQLAYTLLELFKGQADPEWLKTEYDRRQKQRIDTHIRFGDYWYTANQQFTDLKDFTKTLASDVGLDLTPERAWRWIAQGGFIDEDSTFGTGGFSLALVAATGDFLLEIAPGSPLQEFNVVKLNLKGAKEKTIAVYANGQVLRTKCYERNGKVLPMKGTLELLTNLLLRCSDTPTLFATLNELQRRNPNDKNLAAMMGSVFEALEAMIRDDWVIGSYDKKLPLGRLQIKEGTGFFWNTDQPKSDELEVPAT